jgi:two-component system, OmpR family, response regulator RegX3
VTSHQRRGTGTLTTERERAAAEWSTRDPKRPARQTPSTASESASGALGAPEESRGSPPARVLIVEDAESFVDALTVNLEREGFSVTTARDGVEALERFEADRPDLVLLDVMLPRLSGIDVCRAIRANSAVPIIMVTAKSTELDTVVGLEVGADDYVAKPYRIHELVSRMRAVLRRTPGAHASGNLMPAAPGAPPNGDAARDRAPEAGTPNGGEPQAETSTQPGAGAPGQGAGGASGVAGQRPDEVLQAGDVVLDLGRHECIVRGEEIKLPLKEFELLEMLLSNPGRVVTRDTLIDRVWGMDYVGDTKTLDVHIKRLRSRIEQDPAKPVLITTIRGLGYRFESPRR